MTLLNGHILQKKIVEQLDLKAKSLSLALVLVGDDPRSLQYVRMKEKIAKDNGVLVSLVTLSSNSSEQEILSTLAELQKTHHGVMVQLPLPEHLQDATLRVCQVIDPNHDVDMLNPKTMDLYRSGETKLEPPVARAVKYMLQEAGIVFSNNSIHKIVVVGQGPVVGLPATEMLRRNNQNFSVLTKETPKDLVDQTLKNADIIISGAGDPHFIQPHMIQEGTILIDAGVSFVDGVLHGDVDPACYPKASFYSPVPGGVGPVGIACLFQNLVCISESHLKHSS